MNCRQLSCLVGASFSLFCSVSQARQCWLKTQNQVKIARRLRRCLLKYAFFAGRFNKPA